MSLCIPHTQVRPQASAYRPLGYALLMLFVGTTIPTPLYRICPTGLGLFAAGGGLASQAVVAVREMACGNGSCDGP